MNFGIRALLEYSLAEIRVLQVKIAENARVVAEAEELLEISKTQMEEMKKSLSNNLYYDFSDPRTVELC